MRIGIDFDNTIANYDLAFLNVAKSTGLLPDDFHGNKKQVRDYIRTLPQGEENWMRLQGNVYGEYMSHACMADGFEQFLKYCNENDIEIFIVSHKTEYGHFDEKKINLRHAATTWMESNHFFSDDGYSIPKEQIYFESTREDKIARIAEINCDYFIDDLQEVLTDKSFPNDVKRCLYYPLNDTTPEGPFKTYHHWNDIAEAIIPKQQAGIELFQTAEKLLGKKCNEINLVYSGVNSQIYCVHSQDEYYAMKKYSNLYTNDEQNRINNEYNALNLLKNNNINCIPAIIGIDEKNKIAIFEWIDGEKVIIPEKSDIDQVISFIQQLMHLSNEDNAFSYATEACLSGNELISQIKKRVDTITESCKSEYQEVSHFLKQELLPALENFAQQAKSGYKKLNCCFDTDITKTERILNPSDFGLHNAIKKTDGKLVFIDFEYFGWDDPVKLLADFLLHPGMQINIELKHYFIQSIANIDKDKKIILERLKLLLPLYGLRWCTIILNAFTKNYFDNRSYIEEKENFKLLQFQKSKKLFNNLNNLSYI